MSGGQTYAEIAPSGVQRRDVATSAGRIAVWERAGAGADFLLIHGNSASKAAFADLFAAPALAGMRLCAMDLPGSGESGDADDPEAAYTIPAMAQTAGEVIGALGLDRPMVLGWSLGGHIAIEAAGQGVQMRGLILTGTPPCGPGPEEVLQTFVMTSLGDVAFSETPSPEALEAYVHGLYGDSRPIPDALFAAARRCDGRLRRLFAEHWLGGASGYHQRSVISDPSLPIAVIQGDQEPFFDPKIIDTLAWGNLWRGASQTLTGAGHAPFFEQPEAYSDLAAAFIASLGEGG